MSDSRPPRMFEPSEHTGSPAYRLPADTAPPPMVGSPPRRQRPVWPWLAAICLVFAIGVVVLVAVIARDTSPAPVAAPTSTATAAPATSAPLYTVAKTWPAEGGLGGGATLVVPTESRPQAQAAIKQYIRAEGGAEYIWIEVLGHADATEWFCAGEYVPSKAEQQYAVFDMTKEFVNFPADWIKCR